ncbi:MAG: ATP-dependent Clp protease adaptor ClpS [Candidatus Binatia bacterium]
MSTRDSRALRRRLRKTITRQKLRSERQRPPLFAVVLHHDAINRFDYIVRVLQRVFFFGRAKACFITLIVRCVGRSVVWRGSFEIAETKAYLLKSHGPDPERIALGARPLWVTVEPLRRE